MVISCWCLGVKCVVIKIQIHQIARSLDLWANKVLELLWVRFQYWKIFCSKCITMKNMIKQFFWAENKFIPEVHLKQCGFMWSLQTIRKKQNRIFKILPDKAFAVASNQQYDEFHQKLTSIVYIETGDNTHTGIRK